MKYGQYVNVPWAAWAEADFFSEAELGQYRTSPSVRAEPSKPCVREARSEQETDFPDNRALFGHFSYFVTY